MLALQTAKNHRVSPFFFLRDSILEDIFDVLWSRKFLWFPSLRKNTSRLQFMISFSCFLFYFQYAHRGVKYQGMAISIAVFEGRLFPSPCQVCNKLETRKHGKTAQAATLLLVSLTSVD